MIRTILIVLDVVLGVAAVAGGVAAVAFSRGERPGWLRGTVFKSLLWPGLTLLVLVGGSLLAAAVVLGTSDLHTARLVSVEAGVVLVGWGAVMLSALGYRHWAQVAPLVLGLAVVLLSFALPVPGCPIVL